MVCRTGSLSTALKQNIRPNLDVMSLKKMSPTLAARGRYEFRVRSRVRAFAPDKRGQSGVKYRRHAARQGRWTVIEKGYFDAQG
jgi:hypothetical protein